MIPGIATISKCHEMLINILNDWRKLLLLKEERILSL
jgi:hypothetical protein